MLPRAEGGKGSRMKHCPGYFSRCDLLLLQTLPTIAQQLFIQLFCYSRGNLYSLESFDLEGSGLSTSKFRCKCAPYGFTSPEGKYWKKQAGYRDLLNNFTQNIGHCFVIAAHSNYDGIKNLKTWERLVGSNWNWSLNVGLTYGARNVWRMKERKHPSTRKM